MPALLQAQGTQGLPGSRSLFCVRPAGDGRLSRKGLAEHRGAWSPQASGKTELRPLPWCQPRTPALRQAAVQLPLPPGTLPLPQTIELQPHGQCQVQQGDEPQQPVAGASPRLLCRWAAGAELSRARRGQPSDQLAQDCRQQASPSTWAPHPMRPNCPLGLRGQRMTMGPAAE